MLCRAFEERVKLRALSMENVVSVGPAERPNWRNTGTGEASQDSNEETDLGEPISTSDVHSPGVTGR